MSQLARIKENVDWRNDNIQEETYATYLAFDSIERIIESKETELNDCILDNITADEKFKIICRAKDIDIQEMAINIYKIIENNDNYEYKDEYIGICSYEDESMEIENKYYVDIDYGLLYSKDNWIKDHMNEYKWLSYEECEQMDWQFYVIENEFEEKHKKFIKLAIECGINRIILKEM